MAAPTPPTTGWELLHSGEVSVRCTRAGPAPWCRASGHLTAPAARVYALLNNIDGHTALFPRIEISTEFAPGLAHQVVALPFPLSPRDYVVHLDRQQQGSDQVIVFSSVERPDIPVAGVRLGAFAGEFRVHPASDGGTDFSYLWQADLGPDIPSFALPIAWVSQGREIVEGLRAAAAR